jgi:outer membrane protein assembly factor BamB
MIALGLALCSQPAAAADWLNFRGPQGCGISTEQNLPTKWSATENLIWKLDLPGPGASSPIVLGDRVFVTFYTGYGLDPHDPGNQQDLRRHLVCVERTRGKIIWDKEVAASLPESRFGGPYITLHGYASSTPASDGERVYVFFGKTGVLAFDLDGKKLWHTSVGKGTHGWGSAASPLLYKDFVIVNAGVESGALIALNKKTGKEEWRAAQMRSCWGSPALVNVPSGKAELVMSCPNTVRGFDPDTGKELWHSDGLREQYLCPTVVSTDGIIYTIGARSKNCLALKVGGTGNVTKTNLLWTKRSGSNVVSPAIYKDHLYWVNEDGMAYCVKATNGEQVYAERVKGSAYASVTIADGKIYAVTRNGGTSVLAVGPKFELLARNALSDDSTFNASLAVSSGQLFLRSNKALYCIGNK